MKADIAGLYLRDGGSGFRREVVQLKVEDDQHVGQPVGVGAEHSQCLVDGGREVGAATEGVGQKIGDAGLLSLPVRKVKHLEMERKRNQVAGPPLFTRAKQQSVANRLGDLFGLAVHRAARIKADDVRACRSRGDMRRRGMFLHWFVRTEIESLESSFDVFPVKLPFEQGELRRQQSVEPVTLADTIDIGTCSPRKAIERTAIALFVTTLYIIFRTTFASEGVEQRMNRGIFWHKAA